MQQVPAQTAQPMAGGQVEPEKKSKLWLWILIIVVIVVVLGLGYWLIF